MPADATKKPPKPAPRKKTTPRPPANTGDSRPCIRCGTMAAPTIYGSMKTWLCKKCSRKIKGLE